VRRNTPTLGAGARAGPPSPWRPRSWQGNRTRPGLAGEYWLVLGAGLLGLGPGYGQARRLADTEIKPVFLRSSAIASR